MLRFFVLSSVVIFSSMGVAGNGRFADQDVTHMTVPEYKARPLQVNKAGFIDDAIQGVTRSSRAIQEALRAAEGKLDGGQTGGAANRGYADRDVTHMTVPEYKNPVGKIKKVNLFDDIGKGVETLGRAAGDIISLGQTARDRDAAHQREQEANARHRKEQAEAQEAAKKKELAAVLKTQEQTLADLGEIAKSISDIKTFNTGIYKLAEAELAHRNSLRSYVRGAMDYLKGANADYKDVISNLIAQQSQPVDATQAIPHQKEIVNSIRRTAKFQGQKVREFLQQSLRAASSENINQLMQLVSQSLTYITALETDVNVKVEGYRSNVSELKFQLNGPSVPRPVQPIQAASEESNQPAQTAI